MTRLEELKTIQNRLVDLGLPGVHIVRPIWWIFWLLGFKVPLPPFLSFRLSFVIHGSVFGILWGAFMWFFFWSQEDMPIWIALGSILLAGALFGLWMARRCQRLARKYNLPPWSDLVEYQK